MKEYLSSLLPIGALLLLVFGESIAHPQTHLPPLGAIEPKQPIQAPIPIQQQPTAIGSRMNRPLRLSVTVDDQSFLQVKEGEQVREGDVITDNKRERDRLTQQQKSIRLRIQNLKDKAVRQPFEPKKPIPSKPLPPAIFAEEEAAISHAQLKLTQEQLVLETRTAFLKSENPEKRALVNKATVAFSNAQQKVERQEQLIKSVNDIKLEEMPQILQHETAVLKRLMSEQKQSESELEAEKAKLQASTIEQQQQLQQLEIAFRIAQGELENARSKLTAARSRRQILEYDASIEQAKRSQQENQTHLEYSRQQQQYEQSTRDRDYQIAQLSISLSTIDDKLSQIPVVLSPRTGYIRRIKPWVGNNGKYSTTITISLNPGGAKSTVGDSKGEKAAASASDSQADE